MSVAAKARLPNSPATWLATAMGMALLAWMLYKVFNWAVWHAVFQPDAAACQALSHQGACWGVIQEKARPILLGPVSYTHLTLPTKRIV